MVLFLLVAQPQNPEQAKFYLPHDLREQLRLAVFQYRLTRSEIVRRALRMWLRAREAGEPDA